MAASFKERYRRSKETLEWYDALAMAVAVIALVFTFGVRIVKVDGHSMDYTLSNGERILINLLADPDYGDIVVVDAYTPDDRRTDRRHQHQRSKRSAAQVVVVHIPHLADHDQSDQHHRDQIRRNNQ